MIVVCLIKLMFSILKYKLFYIKSVKIQWPSMMLSLYSFWQKNKWYTGPINIQFFEVFLLLFSWPESDFFLYSVVIWIFWIKEYALTMFSLVLNFKSYSGHFGLLFHQFSEVLMETNIFQVNGISWMFCLLLSLW